MFTIVSFSAVFELGLTNSLGRYASYFLGGAKEITPAGLLIEGDRSRPNLAGIAGLIDFAKKLYTWFALLSLLLCALGFVYLYSQHHSSATTHQSLAAYALLSIGFIWRIYELYWNTILFGLNRVRESYGALILGLAANYAVTVSGFIAGWGIISLALGQLLMQIVPCIISKHLIRKNFPDLASTPLQRTPLKALLSNTWNTWLISQSAWMTTSALIIVCSMTTTLETTASLSICMQMLLAIYSLSATFLLAKVPTISALRASAQNDSIRMLAFSRMGITLMIFCVAAAALAYGLPDFLRILNSKTAALPTSVLLLLIGAVFLELLVGVQSCILVACNITKHCWSYLLTGLACVGIGYVLGGIWGVTAIISTAIFAQILINIPSTGYIFFTLIFNSQPKHTSILKAK